MWRGATSPGHFTAFCIAVPCFQDKEGRCLWRGVTSPGHFTVFCVAVPCFQKKLEIKDKKAMVFVQGVQHH